MVLASGDWEAGKQVLTVPVGKENGNVGVLYLGPRHDGSGYTQAESTLLTDVANSLGKVLSLIDAA